jgi:chemotaxis protein CheC
VRPDELSSLQIDALRELGSIGAGHAATALSDVIGSTVDITVPEASIVRVTGLPDLFGGPEAPVGAVLSRLLGDVRGSIMFIAPQESFVALRDLARGSSGGPIDLAPPAEQGLASQAGATLIGAYASAIAEMAGVVMIPAPPAFAYDMLGALLDAIAVDVGMRSDVALLVLTTLSALGAIIESAVLFHPDEDGLDALLNGLGIG